MLKTLKINRLSDLLKGSSETEDLDQPSKDSKEKNPYMFLRKDNLCVKKNGKKVPYLPTGFLMGIS